MKTECTLAEILYIGSVAEKGRCCGVRWTGKYKRVLKLHVFELRRIFSVFSDVSSIDDVLKEFRMICEKEYEIGKFYSTITWHESNQWSDIQEIFPEILQLMKKILDELGSELDKIFVNKRKVYNLLNCLHNLPRVFFDENEETLCNMKYRPITEKEALEYTFANLKYIDFH